MTKSYIDSSTSRQKDICEWLKNSKYAHPFKNGLGFYVVTGKIVTLKSGERLGVLEWLKREGFRTLSRVSNYNILYTPPSDEYLEKISFFFAQLQNSRHAHHDEPNTQYTDFDRACEPDPHWSDSSSMVDRYYQERSNVYNDYYDDDNDCWVSNIDTYDDDDD